MGEYRESTQGDSRFSPEQEVGLLETWVKDRRGRHGMRESMSSVVRERSVKKVVRLNGNLEINSVSAGLSLKFPMAGGGASTNCFIS